MSTETNLVITTTILGIAILMIIGVTSAKAQQEDNKTIINTVEIPLTPAQAQDGLDYHHKLELEGLLHNSSIQNTLHEQTQVYLCLVSLISPTQFTIDLGICDNDMVSAITNHELGDNQTIINLAHTYLKARGIQ